MSKYQIVSAPTNDGLFGINPDWLIKDSETGKYFNGYDFMGSVEWVNLNEACCMSRDEAKQIKADLESADEPAKPETKTMKAIITSYKPSDYENSRKEIMTKDILEYTQWILRAGERGYTAIQDQTTGTLYLIQPDETCRNSFEVKFEF